MHLTVLFLGEVQDYNDVQKSIDAHFHTAFKLTFNKTGKFRGNIYWVGIENNPVLNELYDKICSDLKNAGYKVDWNSHFSPHITLAREVVLSSQPDLTFDEFSVTARRVSLMKSERINGKLTYTEVYGKSI
jgi:2'-5' RNA ligase